MYAGLFTIASRDPTELGALLESTCRRRRSRGGVLRRQCPVGAETGPRAAAWRFSAGSRSLLPLFEYSPLEIKNSIVGYGRPPEKGQVQAMVRFLLKLPEIRSPDRCLRRGWPWPSATPTTSSQGFAHRLPAAAARPAGRRHCAAVVLPGAQ